MYVQMPGSVYVIRQLHGLSATGYETSIGIDELDRIITERLLHWLGVADRRGAEWLTMEEQLVTDMDIPLLVTRTVPGKQTPIMAMDKVEQREQPKSTLQGDLELTNKDLAQVQRALETSASVMSDERLKKTYEKEARYQATC